MRLFFYLADPPFTTSTCSLQTAPFKHHHLHLSQPTETRKNDLNPQSLSISPLRHPPYPSPLHLPLSPQKEHLLIHLHGLKSVHLSLHYLMHKAVKETPPNSHTQLSRQENTSPEPTTGLPPPPRRRPRSTFLLPSR